MENDIIIGDSFIEIFALNKDTNYYNEPYKGHNCHLARLDMEKILHDISPEKTLEILHILGDMNLGREIIGVFHKKT